MDPLIAYIDLEIDKDGRIADIGCYKSDGQEYHGNSIQRLYQMLDGVTFLCGHNIFNHDLGHLKIKEHIKVIDTLYFSPLLFPAKPYHAIVKDYKLDPGNNNNPFIDAVKTKELLEDELTAFQRLDTAMQYIFYVLLHKQPQFAAFFEFCGFTIEEQDVKQVILDKFHDVICINGALEALIHGRPIELAYALSLIAVNDRVSVFPPWLLKTYPQVQNCFHLLRNMPCLQGCSWCLQKLDPKTALKQWYNHSGFRSFGGEPLQEKAVKAAIEGKSLIAIFPTGGGKSITFQLPALMAGEAERGLTVIISPLQSLMKDQVDNLEEKGITDAVTINGLLDPIEKARSIERVQEGGANLLYISPESLRSNTIEKLLQGRHITRFVIDEAHCFSAWGQDFRVDYLYIGDFIRKLQMSKNLDYTIPVSCFTATAKQKVIDDIRKYFNNKLGLTLELFTTSSGRSNLEYQVITSNGDEKYKQLRDLLEVNHCPTIIYVSRTRKAEKLAERLNQDGFNANFYHGQMDSRLRVQHQEAFMKGKTDIMVATSAFGMGVDKSDVGMVIHYEISDSLENYIQEAGRAGRDENIKAKCFVLFDEEDLNKHFVLLNQTKLTIKEINQVWHAIKWLTKFRKQVSNSALEIARKAGWDDEVADMETRIITAVAALEDAGYLLRGNNSPRLYATGILTKTAQEAVDKINASHIFTEDEKINAVRVIKRLFSAKRSMEARDEEGESRIDYLADLLGLQKETVIRIVNLLRQEKILADSMDLKAFVKSNPTAENNAINLTARYIALEAYLLRLLKNKPILFHLKELNEKASSQLQYDITPAYIKTILNIWAIQGWIAKRRDDRDANYYWIEPKQSIEKLKDNLEQRRAFAGTIVRFLFEKAKYSAEEMGEEVLVEFSVLEAIQHFTKNNSLYERNVSFKDIENTLFYLSRIDAIQIEGGFMVLYQRLTIERKEENVQRRYKNDDYKKLEEYYNNKIQQIHIVGEYAQRMLRNYTGALQFVDDYFQLNYSSFLNKYFPGKKKHDITIKMTKRKFEEIYGGLSLEQSPVVNDNTNQYIVVAAGPGSGKTRVLVHKLASLLQFEDVKHDQLLMLTFSRAAVSEFKLRLQKLVGNAAYRLQIRTFHSFCFDLLGRMGDLQRAKDIIIEAANKIRSKEILLNRITKTVLVIDEAQDINQQEFELIKVLVEKNEDMRVILVGDDDQNIYEWRGASPECLLWFLNEKKAQKYTLLDNYRSKEEILALSNQFVTCIQNRLKEEPIISKMGKGGKVVITRYHSQSLIVPVIDHIVQTGLSGSTSVLTKTNEEAAMIAGLLIQNELPAKLVQSNEGFDLWNMQELRFFSNQISNARQKEPIVDPELFEQAIQKLKACFLHSPNLELVLKIIDRFGQEYQGRMYQSDWRHFLAESKFEDFYSAESDIIHVSTIHKAKGKEFDNVFLLLQNWYLNSEESKRLVYVAITRAKRFLSIHYDQRFFEHIKWPGIEHWENNKVYNKPDAISFVLTLEDVWLSYADRFSLQTVIERLLPGMKLDISLDEPGCSYNGMPLLRFSQKFCVALNNALSQGYEPVSVFIRYIVFWKTELGNEIQIVLPEIRLERREENER